MKVATWIAFIGVLWGMQMPFAVAAASTAKVASSSSAAASAPTITNAWARATVPGQAVGAAYLTITSSVATRLISASTDVANHVEVHNMQMNGGVMQMRPHGRLEVPPGQRVELSPGGTHFMLLGLKKPLLAGTSLRLTLTFAGINKAGNTVDVDVPVRPLGQ